MQTIQKYTKILEKIFEKKVKVCYLIIDLEKNRNKILEQTKKGERKMELKEIKELLTKSEQRTNELWRSL